MIGPRENLIEFHTAYYRDDLLTVRKDVLRNEKRTVHVECPHFGRRPRMRTDGERDDGHGVIVHPILESTQAKCSFDV